MDGGDTFLPSVRISEAPSEFGHPKETLHAFLYAESLRKKRGGDIEPVLSYGSYLLSGGDTAGLAADTNGIFRPLWVDNRSGASQIWTAKVTVSGTAVRNGAPELAEMQDVDDSVTLLLAKPVYDRDKNVISVDAYLSNTSKSIINGPIRARVLSIKSATGPITILNSDSAESTNGAVWDFSSLLPQGKLKPGEHSGVKHLEFHLSNVHWPTGPRAASDLAYLVRLRIKVLAQNKPTPP